MNIVMCPDRKLAWFKDTLKFAATEIRRLKGIVIKAWKSRYLKEDELSASSQLEKKDRTRQGKLVCNFNVPGYVKLNA